MGEVVYVNFKARSVTHLTTMFNQAVELDEDPETYAIAEQLYRSVLEYTPKDLDTLNNLGALLLRQQKSPQEASELFLAVLRADPERLTDAGQHATANLRVLQQEAFAGLMAETSDV